MSKNLSIFLIFVLLTLGITYPLILNINTRIPGFFSTDEPYAALWDSWRIKYSLQNNISLRHISLVAFPFGTKMYSLGYLSYLLIGLVHLLSFLTTPVLTYNFQFLLNLFLSLTLFYLLVFSLTRSRLCAFLGSIIFSFCPYQFQRGWQHLGLTYNQWIPMVLWSAFLLKEKYSKKNILLFLLSLFLLFSFDWSIMYLATVGIISLLIYVLFYNWKIKLFRQVRGFLDDLRYFKRVIIIGLVAFIILLPQFFPAIKNRLTLSSITSPSVFNPYHRPFEDLFAQSAKPLGYLLPAATHPIFGKFTEQFVGSQLYGVSFTEHTLYLGWTPLILAFIAFRRWRQERRLRAKSPAWPAGRQEPRAREDFYISFFVFLAIVAWLFSQPPWWNIFGFKVYMPSFFMYKILPMYRAYCRFGIVVMLAVAVLAGFGLKFILERFKSQKAKIAITCLFSGLVLFEFWNYPPYKVIDVSKVPAAYYWLKEEPGDFAVAEYPLDADSPNDMYKFYQTKHEKKIINGTIPGTYANKVAQAITKLSEPKTAEVLKWMGVKYVLVHREGYLQTELIEDREELERIPQNSGLKFIKNFPAQEYPQKNIMCVQKTGPIDVYEVVASPIEPRIEDK